MSQPLVSIIIPTYNRAEYLGQAIDSALAQSYRPIEIIVVDDGSTDDTQGVAARYGDRIRYIHKANGGASSARNAGFAAASGEVLALLDSDDRWLTEKLEKQISLLSDGVGLVHAGFRVFNSDDGRVTSTAVPPDKLDFHDLLTWNQVSTP